MDAVDLGNHIPVNLFVDTGKRAAYTGGSKGSQNDVLASNMTAE